MTILVNKKIEPFCKLISDSLSKEEACYWTEKAIDLLNVYAYYFDFKECTKQFFYIKIANAVKNSIIFY